MVVENDGPSGDVAPWSPPESDLLYRTLFNSATDAIFMMQGPIFVDCNPAALRQFKCTREQILGKGPIHFSPAFQPDGSQTEMMVAKILQKVMSGTPMIFEWWHHDFEHNIFDAEVTLNRVDLGDTVFVQAVVRDISDRKRAEQENRRLALVANTTKNIVVIADWEGRVEWVNPAFVKITGYTFEEVKGKKPGSFLQGPDSNPETIQFMHDRLSAGCGFTGVEILNYTKRGDPYWISIEVEPIRDFTGQITQFIAIISDISDRKRSELALIESERKFRQIVQSSPMGMYMFELRDDGELYLIDANPAADEIIGIDNSRLIGRTIQDALPGFVNTELLLHFRYAAQFGRPYQNDEVTYNDGKVKGVFEGQIFQTGTNRSAVLFLDVTERKQAEESIKKQNEELTRINAELDRFVYSASHDLRAPISSLLGLIEIARLENSMAKMLPLLEMQERSLLRMDQFIKDIISYSRNSRVQLEPEKIDFQKHIKETFEQLNFMPDLGKIRKEILINQSVDFYSDPRRIQIIVNNLIANSIKYADVNKTVPFIEVNIRVANQKAVIEVRDNGDGIKSDELPKIFEMFYRGNVRSKGSGLGLYIVRQVVEKLGGEISVESTCGVGTVFTVELPSLKTNL